MEGPEPFVALGTKDTGELQFRVMIFCPRDRAAELERGITAAFLRAVHQGRFEGEHEADG